MNTIKLHKSFRNAHFAMTVSIRYIKGLKRVCTSQTRRVALRESAPAMFLMPKPTNTAWGEVVATMC